MSTKKFNFRATTRDDELDRDTNDRPVEGMVYITLFLDTSAVATESYYVCDSLKTAYTSFFESIKQTNVEGLIPDSVAKFWASPESTQLVDNNLVDKNGKPIFSDDASGASFYHDLTDNGNHVYFLNSSVKFK